MKTFKEWQENLDELSLSRTGSTMSLGSKLGGGDKEDSLSWPDYYRWRRGNSFDAESTLTSALGPVIGRIKTLYGDMGEDELIAKITDAVTYIVKGSPEAATKEDGGGDNEEIQ